MKDAERRRYRALMINRFTKSFDACLKDLKRTSKKDGCLISETDELDLIVHSMAYLLGGKIGFSSLNVSGAQAVSYLKWAIKDVTNAYREFRASVKHDR